jgi:hypothetical protein
MTTTRTMVVLVAMLTAAVAPRSSQADDDEDVASTGAEGGIEAHAVKRVPDWSEVGPWMVYRHSAKKKNGSKGDQAWLLNNPGNLTCSCKASKNVLDADGEPVLDDNGNPKVVCTRYEGGKYGDYATCRGAFRVFPEWTIGRDGIKLYLRDRGNSTLKELSDNYGDTTPAARATYLRVFVAAATDPTCAREGVAAFDSTARVHQLTECHIHLMVKGIVEQEGNRKGIEEDRSVAVDASHPAGVFGQP